MEGEEWLNEMSEEERNVAHVEKIVQLLVVPHPDYTDFHIDGTWAWARKKSDTVSNEKNSSIVKEMYRTTNMARRMMILRRYLKRIIGRG